MGIFSAYPTPPELILLTLNFLQTREEPQPPSPTASPSQPDAEPDKSQGGSSRPPSTCSEQRRDVAARVLQRRWKGYQHQVNGRAPAPPLAPTLPGSLPGSVCWREAECRRGGAGGRHAWRHVGAGGAAAGLEALSPPWRAGAVAGWVPGSRHILSPRCVPDLPPGFRDCVLLGAGRGCSGGEAVARPEGPWARAGARERGQPGLRTRALGGGSSSAPRGPQRGQGLSDSGAPYRSPPVYETWLSPHSASRTSKTRVLRLPEHYKLLAPESGRWSSSSFLPNCYYGV